MNSKRIVISLFTAIFALSIASTNCKKEEEDNTPMLLALLWVATQPKPQAVISRLATGLYSVSMTGYSAAENITSDAEYAAFLAKVTGAQKQVMDQHTECTATATKYQSEVVSKWEAGTGPTGFVFPDHTASKVVALSSSPTVEGNATLLNAFWTAASSAKIQMSKFDPSAAAAQGAAFQAGMYGGDFTLTSAQRADHNACRAAISENIPEAPDANDITATQNAIAAANAAYFLNPNATGEAEAEKILAALDHPVLENVTCGYGANFTAVTTGHNNPQKCATLADAF